MASNLNQAFMRAYAKERQTQETAAPTNNSATPSLTPAPHTAIHSAPANLAQSASIPNVASHQIPGNPSFDNPVNPQPVKVTQPVVNQGMSQQPVMKQPAMHRPIISPPVMTQPTMTQPVTTRPQVTPSVSQPNANPSLGGPMPAMDRLSRPAGTASATSPMAQAKTTEVRTSSPVKPPVQSAATKPPAQIAQQATDVWRRIDAAHTQQARHPANSNPREPIAAGTGNNTRRMQAAAAAPVAPPRAVPTLPPQTPASQPANLPLVGDEEAAQPQPQLEARRKTVADFLYAAGQYNPGRVLASGVEAHGRPAEATAIPVAAESRNVASPMTEASTYEPAVSRVNSQYADAQYDMSARQSMPTQPVEPMPALVTQEPLSHRTGQILRVDVPRNAPIASPMPVATNVPAQMASGQAMAATTADTMPLAKSAVAAPRAPEPAAAPSVTNPSAATQPGTLDPSTAKYVIEQRRLDRAHKLNEAEEKLRNDAHKIFNPVWEVDNLQWPAVVDKLMQQRADSMAHVAAHLKAACQDGLSVLGVTSAGASEGRTTVACCLARLAAMHGIRVALVDLDMDRPTLCIQTNMEVESDWRDSLSSQLTLEEVAVHSLEDQLTVLPLKPRGNRAGLLASDGRIAEMLGTLAESFELVIVDCSRTTSSGNVITGLAHTQIFDAAIVVVDRRDNNMARVEDAVRIIGQTGIESIGIVDNFSV